MARRMTPLLGTLAAGVALGLLAATLYPRATDRSPASQTASLRAVEPRPAAESDVSGQAAVPSQRMEMLQAQLDETRQRTSDLESQVALLHSRFEALDEDADHTRLVLNQEDAGAAPDAADPPEEQTGNEPLTVATLVDVGVNEQLARDIIRREGEREMQRLELRDRAIRDGTFGTEAYFQSLRALNDNTRALRDEVGDSAYDRYLYASNQPNRVLISSVIPGSPAEQAGIQAGDIILGYAEQRIFSWSELREATSLGERGEYVPINIQRGSAPVSLLLPRGPLGVRLDSTREAPR